MKILIVSDAWHPQINGVVRTYEYLLTELAAMGHDVRIIGPGDFPNTIPMPGYSEIRLTCFPYVRLREMMAEYNADLLHIATEGPLGWAARKYAMRYEKKFTTCYHSHFPDYIAKRAAKHLPFLEESARKAAIWFVRRFHAPSSCVFAATKSLQRTLEDWDFTCPIKQMTRGIDHTLFNTGDKNLFTDLKRPVALYVGRIAIEKNLEAFLSMPWDGDKVVVGNGPDFEILRNKYPQATFTGTKSGRDLADCYRSADVFVFPSKTDTFGMVLVEAMACGLPIAAYPVTGPIDIVTENYLGALHDDLATATKNALLHGTAEQRANHVRAHYSWHKAAVQFLEMDE